MSYRTVGKVSLEATVVVRTMGSAVRLHMKTRPLLSG